MACTFSWRSKGHRFIQLQWETQLPFGAASGRPSGVKLCQIKHVELPVVALPCSSQTWVWRPFIWHFSSSASIFFLPIRDLSTRMFNDGRRELTHSDVIFINWSIFGRGNIFTPGYASPWCLPLSSWHCFCEHSSRLICTGHTQPSWDL